MFPLVIIRKKNMEGSFENHPFKSSNVLLMKVLRTSRTPRFSLVPTVILDNLHVIKPLRKLYKLHTVYLDSVDIFNRYNMS